MSEYCDICGNPLRDKKLFSRPNLTEADIARDWFAKYWGYRGNLKVCSECLEKDPWEIIEELVYEVNDLQEKLEEKQEV